MTAVACFSWYRKVRIERKMVIRGKKWNAAKGRIQGRISGKA